MTNTFQNILDDSGCKPKNMGRSDQEVLQQTDEVIVP